MVFRSFHLSTSFISSCSAYNHIQIIITAKMSGSSLHTLVGLCVNTLKHSSNVDARLSVTLWDGCILKHQPNLFSTWVDGNMHREGLHLLCVFVLATFITLQDVSSLPNLHIVVRTSNMGKALSWGCFLRIHMSVVLPAISSILCDYSNFTSHLYSSMSQVSNLQPFIWTIYILSQT